MPWLLPIFVVVAAVGLLWLRPWKKQAISVKDSERDPDLSSQSSAESASQSSSKSESWLRGEDLKRYPRRLSELEQQLQEQFEQATLQHDHLNQRVAQLSAKTGREELVERYRQDLSVLDRRSTVTRRVLGTVWKTRSILQLRVHLAIAARQRPDLDHLPQPLEVSSEQLEQASRSYRRACVEVREFVGVLDGLKGGVSDVVPPPPSIADVQEQDTSAIESEIDAVQNTLASLRERMDSLADTLEYLGERFRTQRVVESGKLSLALGPDAEALLEEVTGALSQLDELSAVGDKGLADAAVDGLTQDIANLEEAGIDGLAHAEAQLEVQQLLAQFASRNSARKPAQ